MYLEVVSNFKSSNESVIKTSKQKTLTMETTFFMEIKYISLVLH